MARLSREKELKLLRRALVADALRVVGEIFRARAAGEDCVLLLEELADIEETTGIYNAEYSDLMCEPPDPDALQRDTTQQEG